ncbi:nuclear transport factor 2 family protein [Halolamina sp. C58]|uniref:nuclear transport factor 2 family protein n=1 Tax=Halolamina sp. C58 TaxID=3421640 RepID=UPI003EBA28A5
MSHTDPVERYYEAIDAMDADGLAAVLAPDFRHDRPDRTIEGRERFVEFMMNERPRTDTVHAVDTLFLPKTDDDARGREVAAHGRLFAEDGKELFAFVDLFTVEDGAIVDLRTFTK